MPVITSAKNNLALQCQLSGSWEAHHTLGRTISHNPVQILKLISTQCHENYLIGMNCRVNEGGAKSYKIFYLISI